ncbi:MAG TPA: hypothetical protein VFB12_23190, partial [Ktedonobacteraceae bacterium]|nr:hypothetical protein [Ktedonobacteraceae bacterium]
NRPFQGTTVELAMQHVMKEPPSLQERVPNLPAMVEEVIRTALAKDPTKRFASMRAFATALEQACMLEHPRPLVVEQPALQSPMAVPAPAVAPTVVAQTMYDMMPSQEVASQGTPHATFYQSIAPSVTPQIIPPPPPAYHPLEPEKLPSERGKKAAVIGFTLSIINLVLFVYLIIFGQFSNSTLSVTLAIVCWLITLIATPTGVVFSSLGLRSRSRKILAILGLIIGIVALIVVVVFSILVFSYVANHKY